jgi:hypothetical protein
MEELIVVIFYTGPIQTVHLVKALWDMNRFV